MKALCGALIVASTLPVVASDRVWQIGTLQAVTNRPAGLILATVAPTVSVGLPYHRTCLTIDTDQIAYLACTDAVLPPLTIRDPITFAIDGPRLIVRLTPTKTKRLRILSLTRLD